LPRRPAITLRSKARGALLGVAIGDVLGAPFKGLTGHFRPDLAIVTQTTERLHYTEDTAMTIAVSESLVRTPALDESDLARSMLHIWQAAKYRRYSSDVAAVFARIEAGERWSDVAPSLFDGRGSAGHGAAARVAPIPIVAAGRMDAVLDMARRSARVTHAHPLAIEGAALQAAAIAVAYGTPAGDPMSANLFLDRLSTLGIGPDYSKALATVRDLARGGDPDDVAGRLGSGSDALATVPSALASFLLARGSFVETVEFAVAIGGDSDSIAAMAGSLVAAHRGADTIPPHWLQRTEGAARLIELADHLLEAGAGVRPAGAPSQALSA
jgi:poly(ADP-ribose) glycohydrolase ARH3